MAKKDAYTTVMRTVAATLMISFFGLVANAQHLMINQEAGKFFIQHEVLAKQNWYTIGRMYNISPKEIAPFNGTGIEKILSIGQELKIPLTENNFAQDGQPADNEVFVPLYHTVKEKEGLFRISTLYNKVDQKSLKAWNNLKNADLGKGKDIIVGYLRVKKNVSPLASEGLASIPGQSNSKADSTVKKSNELSKTPTAITNNKQETPVNNNLSTASNSKVNTAISNKQEASNMSKPETVNSNVVNAGEIQSAPGTEGAFASAYDEQTRNGKTNSVSGTAAMFRSTSGWKDGKYYLLMNSVPPGTIVKVMSGTNGRVIYAKVLSELPAIKENEGLLIRISNAAAAQLLMNESRFEVSVQY